MEDAGRDAWATRCCWAVWYHYKCRGCTGHTLPRLSGMGSVRRRSSGGPVDLELDNSNVESMFPEELMDREKQSIEEEQEKVEIQIQRF